MDNIGKINQTLSEAVNELVLEENMSLHEEIENLERLTESNASASHDDATGGEGGAMNVSADVEAFDGYIDEVLDSVTGDTDLSEDEAWEAMVSFAEMLTQEGELPPFPAESQDTDTLMDWMAKAKNLGFAGRLCSYVKAMKGL